jgi:hypothetical protein
LYGSDLPGPNQSLRLGVVEPRTDPPSRASSRASDRAHVAPTSTRAAGPGGIAGALEHRRDCVDTPCALGFGRDMHLSLLRPRELRGFGDGGGSFICSPVHACQPTVKPARRRAADERGALNGSHPRTAQRARLHRIPPPRPQGCRRASRKTHRRDTCTNHSGPLQTVYRLHPCSIVNA